MSRSPRARVVILMAMLLIAGVAINAVSARADDPLARGPKWPAPTTDVVRQQALEWLSEARPGDDEVLQKAAALWQDVEPQAEAALLLDRLLTTVALGDRRVAALLELCAQGRQQPTLPDQDWLDDDDLVPLVRNNARLYYGRWLVQERLYDEANEQLADLQPGEVVDPAALLFYRAVVHHRLLEKEAALRDIDDLLRETRDPPRRFVTLAELMREDVKDLQEDTLDHIARRMDDIERRLDLGHAGPKVRSIEDGVIESLDKLIEELEQQQQQQQQQQQASAGGNLQPNQPADQSQILGGSGPGDVARRGLGDGSGWGNLPPKDREEALQQIGKDFPAHYRDTIEQYFRRLASESSEIQSP